MASYTHSRTSLQRHPIQGRAALAAPLLAPRALVVGAEVRLVVLAQSDGELCAIDRASGAFVRVDLDGSEQPPLHRYDIVSAELSVADEIPDPARPEAARASAPLRPMGRLRGRRARRFMSSLVLPPGQALLGFPGPSTTYWDIGGTDPSLALIKAERGPQLILREDQTVRARFVWSGMEHQLPVSDPDLVEAMRSSQRTRLASPQLDEALGFKTAYLLVALSPPHEGHCYKTLAAALPNP